MTFKINLTCVHQLPLWKASVPSVLSFVFLPYFHPTSLSLYRFLLPPSSMGLLRSRRGIDGPGPTWLVCSEQQDFLVFTGATCSLKNQDTARTFFTFDCFCLKTDSFLKQYFHVCTFCELDRKRIIKISMFDDGKHPTNNWNGHLSATNPQVRNATFAGHIY